MFRCARCGTMHADPVRFCTTCGARLRTTGTAVDTGARDRAREASGSGAASPVSRTTPAGGANAPSARTELDMVAPFAADQPVTHDTDPSTRGTAEGQSEELAPGTMIGEYAIEGILGEGGMGTVYGAHHPVIGKKVAIKLLKAALSQDPSIVQRFIQEARAVNRIGHRSIVDIFSFGELPDGRCYYAMEYLTGRSLDARLGEAPPLRAAEVFQILDRILDPLAAAHAAGIIHRDLKPENVFLVEDRGERVVKLLDFGIAKLLRPDDNKPVTQAGVPMGTPLYMSPEQCLGTEIDARSDIYAIGVLAYELFTGRLPFSGATYGEVLSGHIARQPVPPSQITPLPPSLEELILQCLAKDPAARPQSVDEVRTRLRGIAEATAGGPANGSPPSTRVPASSPVLRRTGTGAVVTPRRPSSLTPWLAGLFAVVASFGGGLLVLRGRAPAPTVMVQVSSQPPGASVWIDGLLDSKPTPAVYRASRAPTLHLRLEKGGFRPHEETVAVPAGAERVAVAVALDPQPPSLGGVEVDTGLEAAAFTLDGRAVGDGSGRLRLDQVPPGSHQIVATAEGREPHGERFEVRPGRTTALHFTLAPSNSARLGPSPALRRGSPGAGRRSSSRKAGPDPDGTSGVFVH